MEEEKLIILDCTLRDGGYINNWEFGFNQARQIVKGLTNARVDVVEVGFLRNIEYYNKDIVVCDKIEDLNKLLPKEIGDTRYSAMAMCSNYDVDKLSPYSGEGIEIIRITAHDYDIEEGLEFAYKVKKKGYKLSINPINIMGYSDEKILWLIKKVNQIAPYQFSIVDTFGSMKRRDLDRIVSLVDNNLNKNIRIALHLHENMSLSYSLAQNFIDKHLNRAVAIDGSLMGMGRIPGNLPIELIADYCNEYAEKTYKIDCLLDIIHDYIEPKKGDINWGYLPAYFLSAKYNLHRNYAEHYLNKGDLTTKEIDLLLSKYSEDKKASFDSKYADLLYEEYKNNVIDDSVAHEKIKQELSNRNILLILPGASILEEKEKIELFIKEKAPVVVGINFVSDIYELNFAFFSNNKRMTQTEAFPCKTIVTSNLKKGDYVINYNSVSGAFFDGNNSFIMFLKLLENLGINEVFVAGADGYSEAKTNYYDNSITSPVKHGKKYNQEVKKAIDKIDIKVSFLTKSKYLNEEDKNE